MRWLAFALVVLCASVARADLKADVEKLVHTNLKAVVADKFNDFDKTVSGNRVLVLPDGKSTIEKSPQVDVYGAKVKKLAHKIESLHIVVDADKKLAWFHGSLVATFTVDKTKTTLPMRISGIAVDEGAPVGWKIEALMYARTMPDKELNARAADNKRGAAKTAGDAALAKLVAAWFDGSGQIANDRSKNVAVAVNGTSALELGNGAFAVKLVKAWDALKMWATNVEATTFANGEIAFVRADVMIPVPGKEQATPVVLGTVLVKENNVWRWVALSFTPGG